MDLKSGWGPEEIARVHEEAAGHSDPLVRRRALVVLQHLGAETHAGPEVLRRGLRDESRHVRYAAAWTTGVVGSKPLTILERDLLELCRTDPDKAVRGASFWAIARGDGPMRVRCRAAFLARLWKPIESLTIRVESVDNALALSPASVMELGQFRIAMRDPSCPFPVRDAVGAALAHSWWNPEEWWEEVLAFALLRCPEIKQQRVRWALRSVTRSPGSVPLLLLGRLHHALLGALDEDVGAAESWEEEVASAPSLPPFDAARLERAYYCLDVLEKPLPQVPLEERRISLLGRVVGLRGLSMPFGYWVNRALWSLDQLHGLRPWTAAVLRRKLREGPTCQWKGPFDQIVRTLLWGGGLTPACIPVLLLHARRDGFLWCDARDCLQALGPEAHAALSVLSSIVAELPPPRPGFWAKSWNEVVEASDRDTFIPDKKRKHQELQQERILGTFAGATLRRVNAGGDVPRRGNLVVSTRRLALLEPKGGTPSLAEIEAHSKRGAAHIFDLDDLDSINVRGMDGGKPTATSCLILRIGKSQSEWEVGIVSTSITPLTSLLGI